MESGPVIIVESLLAKKDEISYELRKRGFVVLSTFEWTQSLHTLVALSKKLTVKLSIQENVPLKPLKKYSAYQALLLANAGISIIMRAQSIGATAAWVAHDQTHKNATHITEGNEAELTSLCNYYGPSIALKHGMVHFNRYFLQGLALVGLIMFLEYQANTANSLWTPVYAACLVVWGSYHLQRWRQRHSTLAHMWGTFSAEAVEYDAEALQKVESGSDLQLASLAKSAGGTLIATAALFLTTLLAAGTLSAIAANLPFLSSLPVSGNLPWMAPYAVACQILHKPVVGVVCDKLQSLETDLTKAQTELSLIAKKCLLSCAVFYGVPLHYLLWTQDRQRAQLLVTVQIAAHLVQMLAQRGVASSIATSTTGTAFNSAAAELQAIGDTSVPGTAENDRVEQSSPAPAALSPAPQPGTPAPTPMPKSASASAPTLPPAPGTGNTPLSPVRNGASTEQQSAQKQSGKPEPLSVAGKGGPHTPSPLQQTPTPSATSGATTAAANATTASASQNKSAEDSQQHRQSSLLGATLGYSLDTVSRVTGVAVPSVVSDMGYRAVGMVDGTAAVAAGALEQASEAAKSLNVTGSRTAQPAPTPISSISPSEPRSASLTPQTQLQLQTQMQAQLAEEARQKWAPVLDRELQHPVYDAEDELLHLTVLYGYLALFSLSCPLVPVLIFLAQYVYSHADLQHLRSSRRPPLPKRSSLAQWEGVWEWLSFLSVAVNGIFLLHLGTTAGVSDSTEGAAQSNFVGGYRTAYVLVLNQALLAAKLIIRYLIPSVPAFIQAEQARIRLQAQQQQLRERLQHHASTTQHHVMHAMSPAIPAEEGMLQHLRSNIRSNIRHTAGTVLGAPVRWASNIPGVTALLGSNGNGGAAASPDPFDQSLHSLHDCGVGTSTVGNRTAATARDTAISRLLTEQQSNKFGVDPLSLSAVVVLPAALQYWGFSPLLYVPCALLYYSYLQAQKDRSDRKMAMGIVSDPALIKLVVQEMPSWVTDSQFQRVEWVNSLLQKLWPQLSAACDPLLKAQLQPTLDAQCPKMLGKISLQRFSLGNIAPKIIGVRLYDYTESLIRLDVELRYAGDPSIVVTVGTDRVSTPIEVSELRISALARIELLDLQPSLPGFRAVSVTFMKKPHVEFSLKVARLDIMNIGPLDYNIAGIVRTQLHAALVESILYPKKLVYPMHAGDKAEDFYSMQPVGILYITFVKGTDLKRANVFGSDPYILAKTMQQEVRTAVKYYSLNPEWNETHDFMVYDRDSQNVAIEVYDADLAQMETFLGRAQLDISRLPANHKKTISLTLRDVPNGSVTVECEYIPLVGDFQASAGAQDGVSDAGTVDRDVLYDMPAEQLGNDVLESDDRQDHLLDDEQDGEGVWAWTEPRSEAQRPTSAGAGADGHTPAARRRSCSSIGTGPGTVERHGGAVGVLQVSGIQLRNLQPRAASLFSGAAACYVQCSVASVDKRTRAIEGNEAPVFTESFFFACKHPTTEMLQVTSITQWIQVKLMMEPRKVLGTLKIPVSEVLHAPNGQLNQEYMLQGATGSGASELRECYVSLKLHWTGAATPAHKH